MKIRMKKIILCAQTLDEKIKYALGEYADSVISMPAWDNIPGGIGYHPDMLGFAFGEKLWLNEEYYRANRSFFDALGADIRPCPEPYGKYPDDVRFNAFVLNGALVGREASLAASLKSEFVRIRNVRQGYAKCSSAVFGNNVITADGGIASAVEELGGDVLHIEPGSVKLPGYDYGFIGGALACVSDDTLMAFGNIEFHPRGSKITAFAADKGYKILSFAGEELCDHGGILVLNI